MKSILSVVLSLFCLTAVTQTEWQGKFKQIYQKLPTPNQYRTGSGEPGQTTGNKKLTTKSKLNWTIRIRRSLELKRSLTSIIPLIL